ncbi:MAG: four helix bundle protein [Muribaculum sp.]|nr:four helix bundle protein [Muribaculum sp.]
MDLYSFEKLDAYQEARKLVVEVYRIINILPIHEKYALGSQLQRAVISVKANIAEGCGRKSYKEKIHFLEIAFGSLTETYCELESCMDLRYISEEAFSAIKPQFFKTSRLINALWQSYCNTVNQQNYKNQQIK